MPRAEIGFNDPTGAASPELLIHWGPTLFVDVGFDPGFDPAHAGVPSPSVSQVMALVDTGATESCIDAKLASQLALPAIDRAEIAGAGGVSEVLVHLAQIHVPALHWTIYGKFAAVDSAGGGQHHVALLGRTFLQHFLLRYDGRDGRVSLER